MPRQLIICCDGTNNNLTGRRNDTNVTQLCELLDPDGLNGPEQLLFYDPGVGNPGELPGATLGDKIGRRFERLYGLVYGKGIYENISEAYRFLMRNWQPGDQIFLFGFSRGAFTARSVGGLVTQFGILRPDMDVLVPTLLHVYFSDREKGRDEYKLITGQIGDLFSSNAAREASVHFVGVWDTVASVGAPLLSREITAVPTIVGKRFKHVRQALALDEFRTTFRPRPYIIQKDYDYAAHGQSIAQQWFSGSHCDVGGGYDNEEAGLSQQAFLWMVQQAHGCGLKLKADLMADVNGVPLPDISKITLFLDDRSKLKKPRQKFVHSEEYETPMWALGGLAVRDPAASLGIDPKIEMPPQQSPTVAANGLVFPAQSVWRAGRPASHLLYAALTAFVVWAAAGGFLLGLELNPDNNLWQDFVADMQAIPAAARANFDFAFWQLTWFFSPGHLPSASLLRLNLQNPATAILLDFGLIGAYGYLLARAFSWAFARLAGLRRVDLTPPAWLNRLGMTACVGVLGDVAENFLTWFVLATANNQLVPSLETVFGLLMSAAALVKWLGLAGSLVLIALACLEGKKK